MNSAPPIFSPSRSLRAGGRDPQLGLFEVKADNGNVKWLETMLDGAGHWLTARDIMESCGGRLHDRDVRELASASEFIIAGQRGYKSMRHATAEEVNHCCSWLESQAKKMSERAGRLRRNAHRIFG